MLPSTLVRSLAISSDCDGVCRCASVTETLDLIHSFAANELYPCPPQIMLMLSDLITSNMSAHAGWKYLDLALFPPLQLCRTVQTATIRIAWTLTPISLSRVLPTVTSCQQGTPAQQQHPIFPQTPPPLLQALGIWLSMSAGKECVF